MQGVFDILGPVMIGPSSSHTAGADRLGAMARVIFGRPPKKVRFLLHGSFAKTYRGHGTDKALVAGILELAPDDVRLRDALQIAKEAGLEATFESVDLGSVHPNTVQMILSDDQGSMVIQGASIGGGMIRISRINDFEVDLSGQYDSLLTIHLDKPGVVAAITGELANLKINIAFMSVFREGRGKRALMFVETDQPIPEAARQIVSRVEGLEKTIIIPALK